MSAPLSRKRHIVILTDTGWEKFTNFLPGFVFIGTIQRGEHVGALATKDGRYFCVNNGLCEPLVDRKIALGMEHATTD